MSIIDSFKQFTSELRREAKRLRGQADTTALSQFLRPTLPQALSPWRRVLEPLVAVMSFALMAVLVGAGAYGVLLFLGAGLLIAAILHYVFGINLELEQPRA